MILILLLIPLLTLGVILFNKKKAAPIAAVGSAVQLLFVIALTALYLKNGKIYSGTLTWFEPLKIQFAYALDGVSMVMILLTALVVFAGVMVSLKQSEGGREFFVLLMLLSLGAYGYFVSTDLFALFFFLELAIVPKYLLIGLFGSGEKEKNAMKLALMLSLGSAMVFVGMIAMVYMAYMQTGVLSWDMAYLATVHLPVWAQTFLFFILFTGFGIFTAMFPFHSWAPDGHSSAPTAASMFLAGVSMKLGGYGCLRVATVLLPEAAVQWSWIFVLLGVAGVLYGAFATLRQTDIKYMNAFSSVSHCGFVIMGIAMLTPVAIKGAVLQMVSHGLMTALFFAAIGMMYSRTHTREMDALSGILQKAPFLGSVLMLVGFCSLGLPGMSGFVSEMTVFVGSWARVGLGYKIATILACASIVITAVYILRAVGKVVWGAVKTEHVASIKDIRWDEKCACIILLLAIFFIGLAPFWVGRLIDADCAQMASVFMLK